MKNRCETCQGWQPEGGEVKSFGRHGYCTRIDRQYCCERHNPDGVTGDAEVLAFIGTGDGCEGILYTAPGFGCTEWKAKE
jgi:hypothetical protein